MPRLNRRIIVHYQALMLFDPRAKKAIKIIWYIVVILIIISMILLYMPGITGY
mgnify:CR=1 FL=1